MARPPPSKGSSPAVRRETDPERLIPVVVVGLGEIGRSVARAALRHPRLTLVGAVDRDPALAGRLLAELGVEGTGLKVSKNLEALASRARGGAVLLCTGSRVAQVAPQLEEAFRLGLGVVSTCEELAYPWLYHSEVGERIERAAQKAGVQALGTGVNPGFALDRLVATAAAPVGMVRHVLARRTVDVGQRRAALQAKVGVGLREAEFEARAEGDAIGHVGLAQSCALAALGAGLDVDEVEEELTPILAEEEASLPGGTLQAGRVAGVFQVARGFAEGTEVVRLELTLAVGASPSGDWIRIDGEPTIELEVKGGYPGEAATAWAVANAVPALLECEPGLLTVLDLPAGR